MFDSVSSKLLKPTAAFVAAMAAFVVSVGFNPAENAGSKQSAIANLPTVSISAGEQAKAHNASSTWHYDFLTGDAGFCSNNWSEMINAANRNNSRNRISRRYYPQKNWWGQVIGFEVNF